MILSYLADTVIGIESDKSLIQNSTETLLSLNVNNAAIIQGNIVEGYINQAPYNSIIIEGAINEVPETILDQLSNNGKLATILCSNGINGKAVVFEKIDGIIVKNTLFDANVPLLNAFKSKTNNNFKF